MNKVILEAIKEPLRYIYIAIVSFLLTETVIEQIVVLLFGNTLDPATKVILIGFFTAVIRGLDKYRIEMQKIQAEKDNRSITGYKGLTGF